MLGDIAGKDIHARYVKGYRYDAKSAVKAFAQPNGNALPYVLVERHHKPALFECRDEGCRRNEGSILVDPTGECLGSNDLSGFHIDLGLQVVSDAAV